MSRNIKRSGWWDSESGDIIMCEHLESGDIIMCEHPMEDLGCQGVWSWSDSSEEVLEYGKSVIKTTFYRKTLI